MGNQHIQCDQEHRGSAMCDDPFCYWAQEPIFGTLVLAAFGELAKLPVNKSPYLGPATKVADPMLIAQWISSHRAFDNVGAEHVICNVPEGLAYMLIGKEGWIVQMGEP